MAAVENEKETSIDSMAPCGLSTAFFRYPLLQSCEMLWPYPVLEATGVRLPPSASITRAAVITRDKSSSSHPREKLTWHYHTSGFSISLGTVHLHPTCLPEAYFFPSSKL